MGVSTLPKIVFRACLKVEWCFSELQSGTLCLVYCYFGLSLYFWGGVTNIQIINLPTIYIAPSTKKIFKLNRSALNYTTLYQFTKFVGGAMASLAPSWLRLCMIIEYFHFLCAVLQNARGGGMWRSATKQLYWLNWFVFLCTVGYT